MRKKKQLKHLTPEQVKIFDYIARKPRTSYTHLVEKEKIAANKTVSHALKKLSKEGLIEIKTHEQVTRGTPTAYYGLTWKGFFRSITYSIIDTKDARAKRHQHELKFPRDMSNAELANFMEQKYPDIFYKVLVGNFQMKALENQAIPLMLDVMAGFSYFYCADTQGDSFIQEAVDAGAMLPDKTLTELQKMPYYGMIQSLMKRVYG